MTIDTWKQTFITAMTNLWSEIAAFLPSLLAALVILLIGYFVAKFSGFIVERLLSRLGLNKLGQKIGLQEQLENTKIKKKLSVLFGLCVRCLVFLIFFITATETLGFERLTSTMNEFLLYIPKLIAAGLIIIFGFFLSHIARRLITESIIDQYVDYSKSLVAVVRGFIFIITLSLAFSQLELEIKLLNMIVIVIFACIAFAVALSLSFGTRDLSKRIVSGIYVRELIQIGDEIVIGEIEGFVEQIGSVKTLIKDKEGHLISLPNDELLNNRVKIISPS